jgi:outer membrane protein with beta-barrel domain
MRTQSWSIPGLMMVVCLAAANAAAQTTPSRFEVGGHLSTLRIGEGGNTNAGIGGSVGYDFSRWLAAEAEMSLFPRDRIDVEMGLAPITTTRWSRRRLEGFFGPKVGVRGDRFGAFAKVRPGFVTLTDTGVGCAGDLCPLILLPRPDYRTEFAVDLGGIFEFYPTPRTIARFDLGTTAIRHRSQGVPPCRDCTTKNLSTSVGMGFRF